MDDRLDKLEAVLQHWLDAQRWDRAEEAARQLLSIEPNHEQAWPALVACLIEKRDLAGAKDAAKHFLKTNPHHVPTLIHLAEAQFFGGEEVAAESTIGNGLRIDPSCAPLHALLASIRLARRDIDGARAAALKTLELAPYDLNGLRVIAFTSLARGEQAHAEHAARALLSLAPTNAFAMSAAGMVLRHLGLRAEGMRLLRQMIQREPNEPRWHLVMAEVLWDRNEVPASRRHYREALRLDPSLEEVRKILRIGIRTTREQMPQGWRQYRITTMWDENGHKVETFDWLDELPERS